MNIFSASCDFFVNSSADDNNIILERMQYILHTFNDSQPPLKSKLSKLRHLDSLFFFSLIVALLFFQMFQNHQLREQLSSRKTDLMVQQLLQEKIPQIQKEIEEIRNHLMQENTKIHQKMEENKKLILAIGRQFGFPIKQTDKKHLNNVEKIALLQNTKGKNNLQVFQILPQSDESLENDEQIQENAQQNQYWQNIPQEEIISQQPQTYSTQNYKEDTADQRNQHNFPNVQRVQLKINNSIDAKIVGYDFTKWDWQEFEKWGVYLGKIIFGLISIIAIILMVFLKKTKVRKDKPFIRNLWKNICPQGKKRELMKGQKQILHL